jgi:hypothetical protein
MPERMKESVGLPWIGGCSRNDRRMVLKHKLMLGVIGGTLGALLPGCTAGKQPSEAETSVANAAKDVTIPLEAGKMKNPLPETDEVASQAGKCFLDLAPNAMVRTRAETRTSGATCTRLPWT